MRAVAWVAGQAVNALIAGFTLWAVWEARRWPLDAALFPRLIGIPLLVLCALEAALGRRRPVPAWEPGEGRKLLRFALWIGAMVLCLELLGFPLGIPAFLLAYLVLQGRERPLLAAAVALGGWVVVRYALGELMDIAFPTPWLEGLWPGP